jgi:hypothetical protein
MEYSYLVIILLLILVLFMCTTENPKKENFTNKYIANDHIYLGKRKDGYDLLDDSLFTNVVTYNNDDDPYECGARTAIEKCLENCAGRCIEFGVGHAAYCFPPDEEFRKKTDV